MAVWGIGAYYKNSSPKDKTKYFLKDGCAYIGWNEPDAPALYRMFDSIKAGDLIYIKSFAPKTKQLQIKAVGIVKDTKKEASDSLGTGIEVCWKQCFTPTTVDVTPQFYRNNVFNNTLYEEFNDNIIKEVIDGLMK